MVRFCNSDMVILANPANLAESDESGETGHFGHSGDSLIHMKLLIPVNLANLVSLLILVNLFFLIW